MNLGDGDLGGVDGDGGGSGDGLTDGGTNGVGARHGESLDDGDGGGGNRSGRGGGQRGHGRKWDQCDGLGDVGDDSGILRHMGSADSSQVGQRRLHDARIFGPATHAVLNVLGELGVLAVTIRVGIVLAFGQGNPCVEALGKDTGSRGRRRRRRGGDHGRRRSHTLRTDGGGAGAVDGRCRQTGIDAYAVAARDRLGHGADGDGRRDADTWISLAGSARRENSGLTFRF